jgi:hypothetical protein
MANEIQNLPEVTKTVIVNGKVTEPNAPKPTQTNDGPTPGNPEISPGARSITAGTMVGFSNDNLAHVCDFVSEMQKNINLKKYIKSMAQQIRKAIRAVLKALGFADATGEASWLANTLKSIAREVNYINKQILQPIIEFQQYVVAYIARLRAIIAWILSLPAKFLALLQDCLARLLKLIGSVFTDIGSGLSEGFSEGPSDYDQIITEAKNLANEAQNTVRLSATAVAGAVNVVGSATAGLLIPASEAELAAANTIIQSYESSTPPAQNKSAP